MIDKEYKKAFKEVIVILKNTDEELIKKIPKKFINFLEENMDNEYIVNIDNNIPIDKQKLLKETEDVISLIYRSFLATEGELKEFNEKDKKEYLKEEEEKKNNYNGKCIEEIFDKKRANINNVKINNELIVIEKENFLTKILKKIKNILKFVQH